MEKRFGAKFPKTRPTWLINPKSSARLELDCYNEKLRLAVEYNGKQHYEYVERFHRSESDLSSQLERDRVKREICRKRGVRLIEVPYTVAHDNIEEFLEHHLKLINM